MLAEEATREFVTRLARLKASYLNRKGHEHHDPHLAQALGNGAREIRKAASARQAFVERFIRTYTPWLYNQEGWERRRNGEGPESQYQKEFAAVIEDFDRRHGYQFFN